jgi:hypothetical protein
MLKRARIGFDRTISAEWLDAVAARAMSGEPLEATRKFLWEFLDGAETGSTNNSNRGKTITVLARIWLSVPKPAEALKQAALNCLASTPGEKRIGVHWAMVIGTHPFFLDVATHTGRLLKLHGYASRSQIKRHMTEVWGDRSTLERAIQRVLRSMLQWGLLRIGQQRGELVAPVQRIGMDNDVSELLVHSILVGSGNGLQLARLVNHPALFPFSIHLTAQDLATSRTFRLQRQGDQSEHVELV